MTSPPAPSPFRRGENIEARLRIVESPHDTVERARGLKSRQTDADAMLWSAIRGRRLNGLKFRRQAPLGSFVADSVCPEHLLIVEVDEGYHENPDQSQVDADRSAFLELYGYRILRLRNDDVFSNLTEALETISAFAINSRNAAE